MPDLTQAASDARILLRGLVGLTNMVEVIEQLAMYGNAVDEAQAKLDGIRASIVEESAALQAAQDARAAAVGEAESIKQAAQIAAAVTVQGAEQQATEYAAAAQAKADELAAQDAHARDTANSEFESVMADKRVALEAELAVLQATIDDKKAKLADL